VSRAHAVVTSPDHSPRPRTHRENVTAVTARNGSGARRVRSSGMLGLMVRRHIALLPAFLLVAAATGAAAGVERSAIPRTPAFEPNRGQVAAPVAALGRFGALTVHLGEGSVAFLAPGADGALVPAAAMTFAGARCAAPILEQELPGRVNYLLGDDPSRWIRTVPTFARARYPGLWPGIDLLLRSSGARLEYDVVVHPGGDPRAAALHFVGVSALARSGDGLELTTPAGIVRHSAPRIVQDDGGGEHEIAGQLVVEGTTVRFAVASFDRSRPLLIDPVIELAAPVGGFWETSGLAVDGGGNAFVAGSADEPRGDAMVVKLDRAGVVVFTTFFGGSGTDLAADVAVDAQGRAMLVGTTNSQDFPRVAAAQSAHGGKWDAFVVTLSAAGDDLVTATTLGGEDDDYGAHAAAAPGGGCVLAGWSTSRNFPVTSGAFDRSCGSDGACNLSAGYPVRDVVVARLGADGHLEYATFLGGDGMEEVYDLAVDGSGSAVVVGITSSQSFPTKSPLFPARSGSFITRLASDGRSLSFSTPFPGELHGVAVSADSGVVVGGWAPRGVLTSARTLGPGEAVVAALSPSGSSLQWSAYLGATQQSSVRAVAVGADRRIHVAGETRGDDLPLVMPFQVVRGGAQDSFVATLAANGASLALSTYLGSQYDDYVFRAVTDPQGAFVILALANGAGFPGVPSGPAVVRIGTGSESADIAVTLADDSDPVIFDAVITYSATVTASGPGTATSVGLIFQFSTSRPWTITTTRGTCVPDYVNTGLSGCELGDLAPGDTATVVIKAYAVQEGDSTCTAVLSSFTGDRTPADNVATERTRVSPSVNLAVVQWDTVDPVEGGGTTTFVTDIHLRNSRAESSGVDLVDELPDGAELVSATSDRGPCTADGRTVRCDLGAVGQFTTARVEITVRPTRLGVICNRVTASGDELEPDYADNTATECTTVFARPGAWRALVAGVAHNPGASGTLWRTDVTLVNPADRALAATLRFRAPGLALTRTVELAARAAVDLPNVLEAVFGVGSRESRSGSLEVTAESALVATVRTYNATAKGTFGDLYPAVDEREALAFGQRGTITGVQRSDRFRTNVGALNLGGQACSFRLTLLNHYAQEVGVATPAPVAPGAWWQQYDALATFGEPAGDAATVTVTPLDEGCLLWVYASLVDARTGDPTTIAAQRPSEWTVRGGWEQYTYYLPAAAHLDGANGTVWRTDVFRVWPRLFPEYWASPSMHELFFCQYPTFDQGYGGGLYPDYADTRVDIGFMGLIGADGGVHPERQAAGTYRFATSHPVLGLGRTYNETAGGTFGQPYPFLTSRDGVGPGERAFVAPLRKSAAYRTNLGFQNVSTVACEVRATFYSPAGDVLGSPRTWTVRAERWLQQNDILGSSGIGNADLAYAVVEVLTPGCRVWPYASVIDNTSGDPITITAIVPDR
jgi:hypothetical protein